MTGKVGHWPLHEWSGDAQDLSGNGNTGTVNGATQGVYGVGGLTAYRFDPSNSADVTIGDIADLEASSEFAVAAWARARATGSTDVVLGKDNEYRLVNDSGTWKWEIYDSGNSTWRSVGATSVSSDAWTHLVGVWDGTNQILYLDGSQDASATPTFSANSTANGLTIGDNSAVGNHFDGYICDVRYYDWALTSSVVTELYEWGSGDYTKQSLHDGTDSGAVSRYEFSSGSVTADSWGSNTLDDQTSAGTTTDAIRGDAKSFDGTDDYMDIPNTVVDFGTGSFTVSTWLKTPNTSDEDAISCRDSSDSTVVEIYVSGGNIEWFVRDDSGGASAIISDSHFSTGVWHHACGVYDESASEATLYLNGVKVGTSSANLGSVTPDTNYIGQAKNGVDYWAGDIDDVRIYDRALSSWEVAQLYRWGGGGRDLRQRSVIA